jgi:hypothetical protein
MELRSELSSGVAEHMGLQPLVAEAATRVEPLLQAHEVSAPRVGRATVGAFLWKPLS